MAPTGKTSPTVLSALHDAIRALDPIATVGFEGLIRDIFVEVTGQPFRLLKSGPQAGTDALSDRWNTGLSIGIEGKRYAAKTRLPLDALKSKLRDAAQEHPLLDIWVLATTRHIDAGDARQLDAVGAQFGIDVLILDWEAHHATPPDLAVLCALAPHAVEKRLGRVGAHIKPLAWLKRQSDFPTWAARIRARLTSASVGYAAARESMTRCLCAHMGDSKAARLHLDSHANLTDPQVRRIDRTKITEALNAWWISESRSVAVLIGEEGVGKTWAVLNWWLQAHHNHQFPLTVYLPARQVDTTDGRRCVAAALYAQTRVRDEVFWWHRVNRWLDAADGPDLLILVDGLNQHWSFSGWSDFVLRLRNDAPSPRASFLLTCRPDHFQNALGEMRDLDTPSHRIPVQPFDDSELDAVLELEGLKRSAFSSSLLEMVRIPRLCHLALNLRKELNGVADITPERIVYADWHTRHHAARKAMGDAEFRQFLAGLAGSAKAQLGTKHVTRKELLEALSSKSGRDNSSYEGILSEIVDGRWLESTGDFHGFRFRPDRLPAALGLDLLQEMRVESSLPGARAALEQAFDPYQGMDIAVSILRCATAFSMLDEKVSRPIKQALLTHWLLMQNFRASDFDTFWKCIGQDAEAVLDTAEELWFEQHRGSSETDVLVKSLSNAFQWPSVAQACEQRLTGWFSRYWLDPLEGEILGTVQENAEAVVRRLHTSTRAAEWHIAGLDASLGISIREVKPAGQAWGSYRAVELLSWLPRASMVRPFTAWAITGAVMGGFRQRDEMAWVLRWNVWDADEAEAPILKIAAKLLECGAELARAAAHLLLRALATPEAIALISPEGIAEPVVTYRVPGIDQPDTLFHLANEMQRSSTDAITRPPATQRTQLRALARRATDRDLTTTLEQEPHSGPPLAFLNLDAWAPAVRVRLERRRQQLVLRQWSQQGSVPASARLHGPMMLRGAIVMTRLTRDAWRRLAQETPIAADNLNPALQVATLWSESADIQVLLLSPLAPRIDALKGFAPVLAKLNSRAAAAIGTFLSSADGEHAMFWMEYLASNAQDPRLLRRTGINRLFSSEHSEVRAKAMDLAWKSKDRELANALFSSGWRWNGAQTKDEQAFGSLLLLSSDAGGHGELLDRIPPELMGDAAAKWRDEPAYLDAFANHIDAEFAAIVGTQAMSFPHTLFSRHEGWDLLAQRDHKRLAQWLEPFRENTPSKIRRLLFSFSESFPLMEAIIATAQFAPDLASDVMCSVVRASQSSGIRDGSIYSGASKLRGPAAIAPIKLVLEEANNDEKLLNYASNLQRNGETIRLLSTIEEDIASSTSGRVARGLTLAGFLWPGIESEIVWSGPLQTPPADGWLAVVHRTSRRRYTDTVTSIVSLERFIAADSDIEAFAAFELFEELISPDFVHLWRWKRVIWGALNKHKLLHWAIHVTRLNTNIKAKREGLQKLFLCTKLPLSHQHPQSPAN